LPKLACASSRKISFTSSTTYTSANDRGFFRATVVTVRPHDLINPSKFVNPFGAYDATQNHICYEGTVSSVRDPVPLVIVAPSPQTNYYYQFRQSDVDLVEPLPTLIEDDGQTIPQARCFVRKGAPAIRVSKFTVGESEPLPQGREAP